ncbi:MAG: alpha-amylase, partial [Cyclobacteriaceae bacterium]
FGSKANGKLAILLRNHELSNDIGYRFTDTNWKKYPLTSRKFINWLKKEPGEVINLYLDYEAIGEHHKADTGIFEFLEGFIAKWDTKGEFLLPSQALKRMKPGGRLDIYSPISWADTERDLSAWNGNPLQKAALKRLYEMGEGIKALEDNNDLLELWSYLQSSDHFYYMSTKQNHDARVHSYFSPYNTPYDAYVYYTNILSDMEIRMQKP